MKENKVTSYFLYAIGEIILVVIGILIAVQIDNWNNARIQRTKELHYLQNIKKDLELNLTEMDKTIEKRKGLIKNAEEVLEYYNGKPLENPEVFFDKTLPIYTWRRFFQLNNTYKELVNTGNFALITNEEIKNGLLTLEDQYNALVYEEGHFRYDSEVALYEPGYRTVDFNKLFNNFSYRMSNGVQGAPVEITKADLQLMLTDLKQKNGFMMAYFEFGAMNEVMESMKKTSQGLIELINKELNQSN